MTDRSTARRLVLALLGAAFVVALTVGRWLPGSANPLTTRVGASLMSLTDGGPAGRAADSAWREQIAVVDTLLERGDVSAAARASHDAYRAALGSQRGDAMLAVGEAFVRSGDRTGTGEAAKAHARQAYLVAFTRARRDGAAEAMRRVEAAFAALGDLEVAAQCRQAAARLAARQRAVVSDARREVPTS